MTDAAERAVAPPTIWAISDGAAGNARQALALAAALVDAPHAVRCVTRAPWRWFAPHLLSGARLAFGAALKAPWPDLAIGCGRQAALLTRGLKQWSGGRTFVVQILDPRIDSAHFDVVVAPRHDAYSGANVIQTLGALNPVDDGWLAAGRAEFSTLQQLPQPRTALLVGGPRRGLQQDDAWLASLIANLENLLERDGGSLMIALSRRTPAAWRARLHGAFHCGCVHFWGGDEDGRNPYAGYLAHAQRIVVTPDSVNMLSEACAVGVPVLSTLPHGAHGKLAAFHAALREAGFLAELRDAVNSIVSQDVVATPAPLRETLVVAPEIQRRYLARTAPVTPSPAP